MLGIEKAYFQHRQAAHCESGVTSNLLCGVGAVLSEAMSFGIGSGLFFIHVPWVKVMGLPLTSYRSFPGTIFKKTCQRLEIDYQYQTYRQKEKGEKALDEFLAKGQPVGVRSNIYWLPYIPQQFRFQFNGHNLVVLQKNSDDTYQISDPVLENTSVCSAHALSKARFAKGALAPKGLIYFPQNKNFAIEEKLARAVRAGIKEVVHRMLFSPVPFAGINGIRFLSKQIKKWPKKFPDREAQKLQMAQVIRMQEEIGTGGAGFRYLYAAFLQEAGQKLQEKTLLEAALMMSEVGDLWRTFATMGAQFCKDRFDQPYETIPEILLKIAEYEKAVYQKLRRSYL
ncbi:MAG: BtrH N-terminal domain-containing protein [Bdellovibrionaceae bacterium]|nr:BtrH N-terminal domain-containing protein [Bdellovibrio sp.]